MDNKPKHLEFIQNVITRMNTNSFLIKGWTITLVAALFALAAKDSDKNFIIIGLFPTIIFWFLDAYYLRQERLYVCLYEKVTKMKEENVDFDMKKDQFVKDENNIPIDKVKYINVFKSVSLSLFYGSILFIIFLIIFYLNC